MKDIILVLVVVGIIGGGAYMWYDHRKHEEQAAAYRAEQERIAQKERDEENKRKALAEAEAAKGKALEILRTYLAKEEKSLKDIVEESHISIELIKEDQLALSDVIKELDAENDRKAESHRKRNKKWYDKAERVLSILDSEKINQLAQKYLKEDFAAMKAEYKSRVETILKMHRETTRRLADNRKKYGKAVSGIDKEVDQKAATAQSKTSSANAALETRLNGLYDSLRRKKNKLERLNRGMSSPSTRKEANEVEKEIDRLNQEISKLEEIVALSRANLAHVDATMAETSARRKYDTAISTRQDDDNAVHADMAHERSVFNLAVEYENRSLDRIRNAMKSQIDVLSIRALDAQKKLDYMTQATLNADMMSAEDIANLRKEISKRLAEKVLKVAK